MMCRAFPTLASQDDLLWVSKRSLQCESLDDELRFCCHVSALVAETIDHGLRAQQPVEFLVRGAPKDDELHRTNSPFYCLVFRVSAAATVFFADLADVVQQLPQLHLLLGLMDFVHTRMAHASVSPEHLVKMTRDIPRTVEAWHKARADMQVAAEWSVRLADPTRVVEAPLPKDAPGAPRIAWARERAVYEATQLFYCGRYTASAALFRTTIAAFKWSPPKWVADFLQPHVLKMYKDAPARPAAATTAAIPYRRGALPPSKFRVN